MKSKESIVERLISGYTNLVLTHRAPFLIGALALIIGVGSFIPKVTFDNTPDSFFLEGDQTLILYEKFQDLFSSDEYSLIVLEAPAQWTPEFIEHLRNLQEELASLPNVERVTAITNVRHIHGDVIALHVDEFLPPGLESDELMKKRSFAMSHPYYKDLFVSNDGAYLGILVETEIIKGEVDYKIELTRLLRAVLKKEPYLSWNPRAVGPPIIDADVRKIVGQESALFGSAVFVLISAGFVFIFRSFLGLLLPVAIAVSTIVMAFGFMGLLNAPVTLLTPIIPSFLISVGLCPGIFLMTTIYGSTHAGFGVRTAVMEGMRKSGIPAIMSAMTTASALLAFSSSRIAPIQDVGMVMGLSLVAALCLTLIYVPIGFSLISESSRSPKRELMIGRSLAFLDGLCERVLNNSHLILILFGVLLTIALLGVGRLSTDYYYLGNFKPHTPLRQDYEAVDRAMSGSSTIEVIINGNQEGAFKEPNNLQTLERLQVYIDGFGAPATSTYSLVNLIKELNQALHDGDSKFYHLPKTRSAVAQELLLFESSGHDELTKVVSSDYAIARLTVRVPTLPDSSYEELVAGIRNFDTTNQEVAKLASLDIHITKKLEVEPTGLVPMWMRVSDYLTESQIHSMLISVSVITVVMMIMFQSVILGIIMSGVNTLVVTFVLGVMGWTGIFLDPYTILVAAIALGILDDDSIHFVKHIQFELKQGKNLKTAIRSAYHSAGQGMLYTSVVLVAGFAIYIASTVASLTKFGLLVSLTIALGLLVEYLVTPALMLVLYRMGLLKASP